MRKAPLPNIQDQAKRFRSLTFDEASKAIEDVVSKLRARKDFSTSDCTQELQQLRLGSSWGTNPQERDRLGQKMTSVGVPELFQKVWRPHLSSDEFLSTQKDPLWQNMDFIMLVMWNMSDKCTALCQHSLDVGVHKDTLACLKSLDPQKSGSSRYARVIKGMTGIIHNMLHRVPESRQPIRDEDAVQITQRFRQSPDPMVACKALIVQAYLISEKENEALNSDKQTFDFLLALLVSAIDAPEHKSTKYGFHAEETLVAVNQLAANDANKQRIVEAGFLPHYVRLMQADCSVDEQVAAAEGLWALAFKCPDEIRREPNCVDTLKRLAASSGDERVRSEAKGALWILDDKQQQLQSKSKLEPGHTKQADDDADSGHVFISYQWDSKPTILMIRDRLRAAGYKIWVDVENMAGSVLEAMAEAVEKAAVVIVCLSQKYKESPNCRTEAEYTFRLHKPIIPLRLEPRYLPDGWLGALCGNNLIYDFSLPAKQEDSFTRLFQNMAKLGIGATGQDTVDGKDAPVVKQTASVTTAVRPTHEPTVNVKQWQQTDVRQWLTSSRLQHLTKWFSEYDGSLMVELMKMKREAPESLYAMLRDEKFSLTDMLKLNRALNQLSY